MTTYSYEVPGVGTVWFNVDQALREVDTPGSVLMTVEIEREELAAIQRRNFWIPERIDAVDPTIPGIGVPLSHAGQLFYILIDGTHRAVKALRDGVKFEARLLTDAAARRCFIDGPRELVRWL